ncbi:sulfurtransferase-like selenium metabolism protein YedF [Porphyromonadaceae bacterium W3.11]|nr:sulfurtransferase-like selenium metabolism protein YedF [Porphyromonadaceae bacterium W3.11]
MAIEIDTRGKLCPLPLILFRQGLAAHPEETTFVILTDNPTSCGNLKDFITDYGFDFSEETKDSFTTLTVEVTPDARTKKRNTAINNNEPRKETSEGVTIQIEKNRMGEGADELGEVLILAFLNALLGAERLPKEVICYNSGVLLALKGTPTAEKLMELEKKGVKIILCGTCVDYYEVKNELALGQITNMLTIYEHLSAASRIVKP